MDKKTSFFYKALGERVCKSRLNRNLTQKELGNLILLSRVSVTNIEKGKQTVQVHILKKIADVLKIDVIDLIPSDDIKTQDTQDEKTKNLSEQKKEWIEKIIGSLKESKGE